MKLSEAWQLLARTHFEGYGSEFLCHRLGMYGFCKVASDIYVGEHARTMVQRICADLGELCAPAYCTDEDEEAPAHQKREWRALACLMFAWEAEDRERAARKRAKQRAIDLDS